MLHATKRIRLRMPEHQICSSWVSLLLMSLYVDYEQGEPLTFCSIDLDGISTYAQPLRRVTSGKKKVIRFATR
jgi:hypothetical protein